VTNELEGTLGYISGGGTSKPSVGIRLAPATGTQFADIECSGVNVTLAGSMIATVTAQIDKMTLTSTLRFKALRGKQNPGQFEGGSSSSLTATSGSEAEQAGLTSTESNSNEELLEIKAVN
jgi:hypothetical protein